MDRPLTFLGIAGSLRRDSYNRAALRAAQRLLPDGVALETFDIAPLPLFNQDEERNPPVALTELKRRIRAADAIVFATPEYNYSMSGVLKNALDCASRPHGDNAWAGKPVAIMSASMGLFGGTRAQHHLRQSLVFLDMCPINQPEVAIANAAKAFGPQGDLVDETTRKLIRELLTNLARWTRRLQATAEGDEAAPGDEGAPTQGRRAPVAARSAAS